MCCQWTVCRLACFHLNTIFGVKITNGVTHSGSYTYSLQSHASTATRAYSRIARVLSLMQCVCAPKTGMSLLCSPVYRPAYSPLTSTFNRVVAEDLAGINGVLVLARLPAGLALDWHAGTALDSSWRPWQNKQPVCWTGNEDPT